MVMVGEVITSWLSTLVLFRLMVSPKTLQAWENLSMRRWSSCSVKELTAAKSMSLIVVRSRKSGAKKILKRVGARIKLA